MASEGRAREVNRHRRDGHESPRNAISANDHESVLRRTPEVDARSNQVRGVNGPSRGVNWAMSSRSSQPRVALSLAVLLCSGTVTSRSAQTPDRWFLSSAIGSGWIAGEYGDVLREPVSFELSLAKERDAWRFGGALEFGSLVMQSPYDDQDDWSRMGVYGLATRVFRHDTRVRPYLQARLGLSRVHPRSSVLHDISPEDFARGHNPTHATNGIAVGLLPGMEIDVHPTLALDLSAAWVAYKTGELRLTRIGREPVSVGHEWQLRGGLAWHPLSRNARRDAWGVPRSWGWATGEMLAINFVASALNEYVRGESAYPITARTIKGNFDHGFAYDDNDFRTNQLVHPFNGGAYFNTARANGIGFWGSAGMALVGAFVWECCGESQPMSWNDMVSTGLGGIARGEIAHRVGAAIVDNTATGRERLWREVGAFLVNPVGEFNRLVSGRARRVFENPSNPNDWRPQRLDLQTAIGARVIGEGASIVHDANAYGFLELDLLYGDAFVRNRRPFDRFDAAMQLNFGEKTRLGRMIIRGDLWSKPLGDTAGPRHVLAVVQDFDYIDNEAYVYGGQGFGLALFSQRGVGRAMLRSRAVGYLVAGAAVNAEYSFLAEIPNPRQQRNYDYGGGTGAALELLLTGPTRLTGSFSYRYTLIAVRNGSLYNPPEGPQGSSANHHVHRGALMLTVPIPAGIWLGSEFALFYRDSRYSAPELKDAKQQNPEVRVFLAFRPDLGRGAR